MSRSWGVVRYLHQVLPHWVPQVFVYVTQLGNAGLFFVVGALLYWYSDNREKCGFLLAATLGALSLTLALKGFFALARPPQMYHVVNASGYGFPSGHALGSTVFWFALALTLDRWSRAARLTVASVIVVAVCLARLVLGVHFAVDVIAGTAIGLVYLAVLVVWFRRRPKPAFALAVLWAFAALCIVVLMPPVTKALAETDLVDAVTALGGTLGALVAWELVGPPDGTVSHWTAAVGLLVLGTLSYIGLRAPLPLAVVFGINVVVQGGIVAYPKIVGRRGVSA